MHRPLPPLFYSIETSVTIHLSLLSLIWIFEHKEREGSTTERRTQGGDNGTLPLPHDQWNLWLLSPPQERRKIPPRKISWMRPWRPEHCTYLWFATMVQSTLRIATLNRFKTKNGSFCLLRNRSPILSASSTRTPSRPGGRDCKIVLKIFIYIILINRSKTCFYKKLVSINCCRGWE